MISCLSISQSFCPGGPTPGHGTSLDRDTPSTPDPAIYYGAITRDLFRFVHFRTPRADIWWLLKQVQSVAVGGTLFECLLVITVCNSSCGKVMFSRASVKNSVHGGVSVPLHAGIHPLGRHSPWADNYLGGHPQADTPTPPRWPLQRTTRILLECILV